MSKQKRKRYAREYKLRVVEQSYEVPNIAELASELGIRPELIYRWGAELAHQGAKSFPGNGNKALSDEERENARLRKELSDLREDHAILKKAIGIFSKTGGKNSGL